MELSYSRYPLWWNRESTKDVLRTMLSLSEWKFAKKEKEAPNSKSFVNLNYMDASLAFDIEDTSFYDNGEKVSTMYVWQFGMNNTVFMGRTWDEFLDLCDVISEFTDRHNRAIIFVHFLDHEFAFMRKYFKFVTVFSRKTRSPIYAITDKGLEFRDSYILTGKSLAKSAEDIRTYKGMKKQVGDLDYTLMRGTKTHLTKKEIGYCMKDVQILNTLIYEKVQDEKGQNIGKLPLTNTGYVRRYVRGLCLPGGRKNRSQYEKFFKQIHSMNLTSPEYRLLKQCFAGGFTHANALYVGDDLKGRIDSIDFTSSYPAVMLSNAFPMSTGRKVEPKSQEELEGYLNNYCCVFVARFKNIRQKENVYENIISESKCRLTGKYISNNGRIQTAEDLTIAITNVDLKSIRQFYDYDYFNVGTFYIYKKGFLPKPIIEAILDLYKAKTTLKGIPEKAVEYLLKKGMLNSTYGMIVTDIVKELVLYSDDWDGVEYPDLNEAIEKYNNSKKRFTFYPWGVFVTSYARRNLYSGILTFGKDYVYSDTDSIKCLNMDKHMNYVNSYNNYIVKAIDKVLTHYGIDETESRPKNKKGVEKQIGVWDWETETDPYTEFKTLGAKRYMYTQSDGLHITVAGVSKKMGMEYISKQASPFDFFDDGMTIDADHSGKLTHTYIDDERHGVMVDYRGTPMQYDELSCVHLEKSSYEMSLTSEFKKFVHCVQTSVVKG